MTQTLEPTTTAEPSAARRRVETWLADFEAALAARDAERAAGLFATTSFWRDLIAFTWNLTTVENRDGVEDLLRNTMEIDRRHELPDHRRRGARRGRRRHDGLVPIRDRGRTRLGPAAAQRRGRLDVPDHARRAQGPRGEPGHDPAQGRRARCPQGAGDLEGAAGRRGRRPRQGPRSLGPGDRRRPGRHRARRAAAPARRRPSRRGPARPARRPVAQPVQVAVPARPRLVRPPALPAVPAQLAGLRAEGQDRRLARDVHADHGDQLLGLHDRQERHLGRREEGVDGHRRPRRRGGRAAPQAARLRARGVGQAERPDDARPGRLPRASSTTARSTRARTPTRTRRSSSSGRTTRRSTSAGRCGRSAPTSRWCSAAPPTSSGRTR